MDVLSRVGAEHLERLGRALGTPTFYQALLRVITSVLPGEFESITVYSRQAQPRLLHFAATSQEARDHDVAAIESLYNSAFFRFDPFFRYWREVCTPGVVPLYDIADLMSRDELYMTSYMPAMHMKDDVVMFLSIPGDRAIALGRERSWRYESEEVARLKLLYPLLSGLNEAHLRDVNPDPGANTQPQAESKAPAPPPLDFSAAVDGFTASGFTPREREILGCILAGFSNDFIADRLEIGVGTVRNHRKRLYAKLDVTSEREIFTMFIGYLTHEEASSLLEPAGK